MRGLTILALVGLLIAQSMPSTHAQPTGDAFYYPTDWVKRLRPSADVQMLDENLLGDHIDPQTGALSFEQTDVSLPGNSHLEVAFRRRHVQGEGYFYELKDWSLLFPVIKVNVPESQWNMASGAGRWGKNRCTQPLVNAIPYAQYNLSMLHGQPLDPSQYSNGVVMDIPGQGAQQVLDGPGTAGSFPAAAVKSTTNGWYLTCISNIDGAGTEGFYAYAPNGDRYRFDKIVARRAVQKFEVWSAFYEGEERVVVPYNDNMSFDMLAATEVTDVDGNWVHYEYDSAGYLTQISSNDLRQITIAYDPDGSHRVISATANGRTWSYAYANRTITVYNTDQPPPAGTRSETNYVLTTVTRPDARTWQYELAGMYAPPVPGTCTQNDQTVSVTHPDGVTGTFLLHEVTLEIAKGGPFDGQPCPDSEIGPNVSRYADVMAVTRKTLATPGAPNAQWDYQYGAPGTGQNITTILPPDGSKQVQYFDQPFLNSVPQAALLRQAQTFQLAADTTPIEIRRIDYSMESAPGWTFVGSISLNSVQRSHESLVRIERGSDWYETRSSYHNDRTQANFDYGNPYHIERQSNVATDIRTTDITYVHNTANWILGLRDTLTRNGKQFEDLDYDTHGHVTTFKKFGVPFATFTYFATGDAAGQLNTYKDALNNTTTLSSYRRGVPQTVLLPDGNTFSRVVDDNGWVTSETNQRGYATTYGYNSVGRLTGITPPSGTGAVAPTTITYTYPAGALVQTITHGALTTTNTFDGRLRPYAQKREDTTRAGTVSYVRRTYDAFNRTTFESFPKSADTDAQTMGVTTAYDALGRVTQTHQTVSPNATISTAYLSGNRVQVIDALGHVTVTTRSGYANPEDGGPTLIHPPAGADTTITYDVWGDKDLESRVQGPLPLAVTNYDYDTRLRLTSVTDPDNATTYTYYDDDDRPIVQVDGVGRKTRTVYDAMSRPITVIRGWTGGTSQTDPIPTCLALRTAYNFAAGVVQECYSEMTYTPTGETASVSDANGNVTNYTYDQVDRRTVTTFPGGTLHEDVAYDALDHPDTKRTRAAETIDYTYDALGRQLDRLVPGTPTHTANGHTVSYSYSYDAADRRTMALHGGMNTMYSYDAIGRLSWQKQNGTMQVSYTYDADNELLTLTYPDNWVVTYGYDTMHRVTSATDTAGPPPLALVEYDPLGRRSKLTYRNGTSAYYTFSPRGDLRCLAWNYTGAAPTECATGTPEVRWSYAYNGARQVVGNDVSDAAYTWGPPQTTSIAYTTNALNQYVTVSGASVSHNANGNETTDQRGHSYTYDAENVLRTATGIATYQYYGDGTRRQKNVGGVTTQYYYADTNDFVVKQGEQFASDQEIAEFNGMTLLRRYVRLPGTIDEPFLMIDMTQVANDRERWVHQNRQGSVVALTDAVGALKNQFHYDPYGRAGTEGSSGFPFRYTGQRIDAETGLYYYKARYYDPDTGRFLQTDLVAYEDDLNLYSYVGNDPVGRVDPSGRAQVCSIMNGKTQACVWVDGNGNGDTRDNDLTSAQAEALGREFGTFIRKNNGSDISHDGTVVTAIHEDQSGNADMVRAVTQFLGAASGQGSAGWGGRGIDLTTGEGITEHEYSGLRGGYSSADDYGFASPESEENWIFLNTDKLHDWFQHPSWIARVILHEMNHYRPEFRDANANRYRHQQLDARARWLLGVYGLADGGCPAIGGDWFFPPTYPGC